MRRCENSANHRMSKQVPVVADIPPTTSIWDVAKQSVRDFIDDGALSQAAAISFYMLFSMAPLLVIIRSIAGFVWEPQQVRGQLMGELGGIIGPTDGEMLEEVIAKASERRTPGVFATVVGIVTLLVGALGVFGQLKTALNTIWEVRVRPGRGWKGMVIDRLVPRVDPDVGVLLGSHRLAGAEFTQGYATPGNNHCTVVQRRMEHPIRREYGFHEQKLQIRPVQPRSTELHDVDPLWTFQ
jgi:hypothetical protein